MERTVGGSVVVEGLLVIGLLALMVTGGMSLAGAQSDTLRTRANDNLAQWQRPDQGWGDADVPLYINQFGDPEARIESALARHLPTQGAQWAVIQPLPHALSYLSGLKPFSELRGYRRGGLGIPVEMQP